MFLHVSTFIKEDIDVLMNKANKTKPNKKDIDSINKANKMAACLAAIYNKTSESEFSTFEKMFEHLQTIKPEKKKFAMSQVKKMKTTKRMMMRKHESAERLPFQEGERWQGEQEELRIYKS